MSYPPPVLKGPEDGSQNLLRVATLREGCTAGPGATGMKWAGKDRTFLWKANRRVTPTPTHEGQEDMDRSSNNPYGEKIKFRELKGSKPGKLLSLPLV